MASEVKLPRLGQGMESGTIVRWLKAEGDPVEKGEPLYELDTEKVTQEVEAEASGVLLRIDVAEGEVEVGRTIAVIGEQGEAVSDSDGTGAVADQGDDELEQSAEKPAEAPAREPERERGRAASAETPQANGQSARGPEPTEGRVKASPLARRIARERGLDLSAVTGTGPEGRIVAEDVERAAAGAVPATLVPSGEVQTEKLSSLRRTVARRMTEAWQAPAFQITMSADMTRARALRERLVELTPEDGVKPTISDVLTKIAAQALARHPAVNVHFAGDSIQRFPTADIGIAVAIPGGLIVPVIRDCGAHSIADIATARADVVGRARAGKLQTADLEGGTFTISNLGMFGVEQFVAVLNPPQAAILAVGAIEERPVVERGELLARPLMTMTMTCDHRSLDGATAAEFLRTVKAFLEEPGLAL